MARDSYRGLRALFISNAFFQLSLGLNFSMNSASYIA